MSVPSLMYGLERLPCARHKMDRFQVLENKVGRIVLGANKYAVVEVIGGFMGCSTFKEGKEKGY